VSKALQRYLSNKEPIPDFASTLRHPPLKTKLVDNPKLKLRKKKCEKNFCLTIFLDQPFSIISITTISIRFILNGCFQPIAIIYWKQSSLHNFRILKMNRTRPQPGLKQKSLSSKMISYEDLRQCCHIFFPIKKFYDTHSLSLNRLRLEFLLECSYSLKSITFCDCEWSFKQKKGMIESCGWIVLRTVTLFILN